MFSAAEIADREQQWRVASDRADALLALSQSVADDAVAGDPALAAKVHVCGFRPYFPTSALGADPKGTRIAYGLPDRYLLVSNQVFRHKNHALVIAALARLRERGASVPTVVFTGRPLDPRHPDLFSELLQYVARQGLHEHCRFLGVVPRADQLALIRAADAIVQPSLFEGRGAILEEAAVLGTLPLCSDLPVNREQAVATARYFDPADADALADLMAAVPPAVDKPVEVIVADSQALTREYGHTLLGVLRTIQSRAHS
jgi:glycosyltransferase involved in cell wall biosynthesis